MTEIPEFEWRDQVPSLIPAALRLATRLCGDSELAEDAVQDSLIKLARYGTAFKGQAELSTYFARIVINVCNDLLRQRQRHNEVMLDGDVAVDSELSRPEVVTEQAEQVLRIRQAVERLPERQRNVLVLAVWEQRTTDEIARLLEITVQNVYSTLAAARKQLRHLLKEESVE